VHLTALMREYNSRNTILASSLISTVVLLFFSADPKKTLHLRALDGAKDRLHLFEASLLEEGSFDAAVDGCDCVFHTASPFYHNVKDPKVCYHHLIHVICYHVHYMPVIYSLGHVVIRVFM
jgi:hypothetical protein